MIDHRVLQNMVYKTEGEWCNCYITNGKRPVMVSSVRIRAREASTDILVAFDKLNHLIAELIHDGSLPSLYPNQSHNVQSEPTVQPYDTDHEPEPRQEPYEDNI